MISQRALLQRIDNYLNTVPRAASDVEEVGPFTLFFRRDTPIPELCYARPTGSLSGDLSATIAQVREAFAVRGFACRWEFLADLVPDLPAILVRHGFPAPLPRPLMVVTRDTFHPEKTMGAQIEPVLMGETRAVSRVLGEAFQGDSPDPLAVEDASADLLAPMLARGSSIYAAYIDGKPVAGGVHSPVGDTTEVAGIGTLAAFRRRGIAGALTSALVADAFARGCECVFLSAANETVQRVYARLGFVKVGTAMDTADKPYIESLPA